MKYDHTKVNQNEFQCVLGFQEELNIIFELVFLANKVYIPWHRFDQK